MLPRAFSSREVAEIVGADPSSVNRWIDSGQIKAYRTPGGHRRVLPSDLVEFLGRCGMPIPDELRPAQRRILLIDDDKMFLKSLRRSLQRADRNLEVHWCDSSVQALLMIGSMKPDVIVLDVYMPGLDGVEVCERISKSDDTANTTIIAVTGRPSPKLEQRLLEAGAVAMLSKPVKASTLLEVLEEHRPGAQSVLARYAAAMRSS